MLRASEHSSWGSFSIATQPSSVLWRRQEGGGNKNPSKSLMEVGTTVVGTEAQFDPSEVS